MAVTQLDGRSAALAEDDLLTAPRLSPPRRFVAPLIAAVLASRLLVMLAGAFGELAGPRRLGWTALDPTHLTARLGAVGNVLAATAVRWDSIHYLDIAQHGYRSAADAVFFPLYPLLIHALGSLTRSDVVAGVAISAISFAAALVLLHRLTRLELGPRAADATILLLALAPTSFFFTAVYTESLFLALSVGAVYAARLDRHRLAAFLGCLAAATRITGVLLVVPLVLIHLRRRRLDRRVTWALAVPSGLVAYLGFVYARGFGALAPFVQEASGHYGRHMSGAIGTIVSATQAAGSGLGLVVRGNESLYQPAFGGALSPGAESVYLLLVLAVAVLALVAAFRCLPVPYGAYGVLALVVCIWSPVASQPLESFDRYVLTIFPLWMAGGRWLAQRRRRAVVLLVGAVLLAFWSFAFARWAFVA